ncbi:uncharacterized protein LOC120528341 isoform X2 [Polypterus senegalus]|uniref:uncharacterized protein LOC120528341 isoform X2 n=1 Tax=Polypterus senegalus TaxID=55291 RepID=UPI001965AE87|nr:uncharacterized protein LOC120528341 isoform X2 [Polypterus senegalus]
MIIVHSLIMLQALSVTKGFSVSGSDEPLVAALGEDIILPCNVDTPVPLEELELEWIKKDTSSLVHLSVAGEDQPESQHKSYRNRTQIFHENLLIGDYSLKLKKTEVQDEGKYRCVVHSRTQSEEVIVELKSVERLLVTGTNGPLFVYAGGEIVLNCFVNTHIPIEKLEVQWVKTEDGSETLVHLFVEGEDQPESQNQLYKGRTELSNESLGDGNFSLKLKSVGIKDKGIYKCKVHTNTESAVTTIELDVGPSVLHIFLYVFSIGSLLIGLGTVIQAGCYLFRKTQSKMGYYCFFVNIVIPHVLLAFAFVLWGILEDWAETVTCITTHLLRVLLLFLIVSDKLRELGMCQGICFQQLTKNVFVINIIIIEALMAASAISEMQRMKIQNLKDDLFFIICATLFALFNLCSIVILTFRILKVSFHRSFHFMRCVEQFSFKNIVLLHYVFLAMYANFISNRSDFFIGYIIATVVTLLCLATLLFHKNIQCPCKCLAGDCPKHADPWSDNETTTGDEEEPLSTAEWLRGGSCPEVSSPKTSAHRVEGALEDRKFLPKTSTGLDGVCCVPAGEYKKAGPTNVNPGTPEDPTEHAQELHGSQPAGVRERLSSCAASLAGIIEPDECAQDAGGDYGRAPESRTGVVNAVRRGILQSVRCVGTDAWQSL